MYQHIFYILFVAAIIAPINTSNEEWRYFGQEPPHGDTKVFAVNIIDDIAHSSPAFSPDFKQIYWSTVSINGQARKIYFSEYRANHWTTPKTLFGDDNYHYDQPFISSDGNKIYYGSNRPSKNDNISMMRINVSTRVDTIWDNPEVLLGTWTPSVTKSNIIYFVDRVDGYKNNFGIYRAYKTKNTYQKELLPEKINDKDSQNWCPYISPDEKFLLFSSDRNNSEGDFDIYISYRNDDHIWSDPINLGEKVNTEFQERFPSITPDGKYLFFTRSKNESNKHQIYWIDIESVRAINIEK